jgi:hypothetical protein
MIKLRNVGSAILHGCLFKRQEKEAYAASPPIHFFGEFCAKNQLSAREVWKKLYFMVKYRRVSRQNELQSHILSVFETFIASGHTES